MLLKHELKPFHQRHRIRNASPTSRETLVFMIKGAGLIGPMCIAFAHFFRKSCLGSMLCNNTKPWAALIFSQHQSYSDSTPHSNPPQQRRQRRHRCYYKRSDASLFPSGWAWLTILAGRPCNTKSLQVVSSSFGKAAREEVHPLAWGPRDPQSRW